MADVFLSSEEQDALASRIRSGDRSAEDDLVNCYGGRVFAMLVARTRDREAARDLFQETMLAAVSALRKTPLRESGKLAAFVHGTARNVANSYLRSRASRPEEDSLAGDTIAARQPDLAEISQRDAMVQRALQALDPTDQDILTRTLVDGQKPGEIARLLGLSPDVVRQRKSRAVKRVVEFVGRMSQFGVGRH